MNCAQAPNKKLTSLPVLITMDLIITLPVTQGLILQDLKLKWKHLGPYI